MQADRQLAPGICASHPLHLESVAGEEAKGCGVLRPGREATKLPGSPGHCGLDKVPQEPTGHALPPGMGPNHDSMYVGMPPGPPVDCCKTIGLACAILVDEQVHFPPDAKADGMFLVQHSEEYRNEASEWVEFNGHFGHEIMVPCHSQPAHDGSRCNPLRWAGYEGCANRRPAPGPLPAAAAIR